MVAMTTMKAVGQSPTVTLRTFAAAVASGFIGYDSGEPLWFEGLDGGKIIRFVGIDRIGVVWICYDDCPARLHRMQAAFRERLRAQV